MAGNPGTSHGRDSKKNPGRTKGPMKSASGGQIDIIAAYDTRYPDKHCKIKGGLGGNGPRPANPFGHRIARPRVGKGGPR